jgi:hypothetical protein
MTKMPPAGYPAFLQYLQSGRVRLFERIGDRSMMADDLYLLGVALSRMGNDKGSTEVWKQGCGPILITPRSSTT